MKDTAFKRLMSLLLVVVMLFGMLPATFATEPSEGSSTNEVITSSSNPPVENNVDTTEETTNPAETIVVTEAAVEATTEASEETTANTKSSEESTEASSESADETTAPVETTAATEDSEAIPEAPTDTTDETEAPTDTTGETEAPTEEAANPTAESTEATHPVSDPTADVESEWEMEATFADVELTEDLVANFLAIAESQLGYKESTKNFTIDDSGEMKGYTRYGDWWANGYEYGDWCAMFVSFCLYYAGYEIVPMECNCQSWIDTMKTVTVETMWYDADDASYIAAPGDIIFYDRDGNGRSDHVGIVKSADYLDEYDEETGFYSTSIESFMVIEGNYEDRVALVKRANDDTVMGFIPTSRIVNRSGVQALASTMALTKTGNYITGNSSLVDTGTGLIRSGRITELLVNNDVSTPAYCIDPGTNVSSASYYVDNNSNYMWNTFTSEQKQLVALALACGHASQSFSGSSRVEKYAATQIIIWEIIGGFRSTTYPYNCSSNHIYNAFKSSSDGTSWTTLQAAYSTIEANMRNSAKIPSFTYMTSAEALANPVVLSYNASTGKYEATLYDANAILQSYGSFSSSGITFTKNGNYLVISATADAMKNGIVTVSTSGTAITTTSYDDMVNVWASATSRQSVASFVSGSAKKANVYLSMKVDTGTGTMKKLGTEAAAIAGYKFKLFQHGTGSDWYGISNADGTVTWYDDEACSVLVGQVISGLTDDYYTLVEYVAGTQGIYPDYMNITVKSASGAVTKNSNYYLQKSTWDANAALADGLYPQADGNVRLSAARSGGQQGIYLSGINGGGSVSFTVKNAAHGSASIKKAVSRGSSSDGSDNLAGYKIKLYNWDNGKSWTAYSNENGDFINTADGTTTFTDLSTGTYDLIEYLPDLTAVPTSVTITVWNADGTCANRLSYFSDGGFGIAPSWVTQSTGPNLAITMDLNPTTGEQLYNYSDFPSGTYYQARLNRVPIYVYSGQTLEISIDNSPTTYSYGSMTKVDSNGQNMSGYHFKLYRNNSNEAWYGISDDQGIYMTYSGTNDGASVKYGTEDNWYEEPNEKTYTFEGLADGTYILVEQLSLYNPDGTFPESVDITVTKNGAVTYQRTYTKDEITQDQNGDARLKDIEITGLNDGGVLSITITNDTEDAGSVWVQKKIEPAESNSAENRENWRIELYDASGNSRYAYTDTDGIARFTGLTAGETYYIREAAVQDRRSDTDNWVMSTQVLNATVVLDEDIYAGEFTNTEEIPEYASLSVKKAVSGITSDSSSLQGWVMELYDSSTKAQMAADGTFLMQAITNATGTATFKDLDVGKTYYIREAPESRQTKSGLANWNLSTTVLSGEVSADIITSVGTITNTYTPHNGNKDDIISISGTITVKKTINNGDVVDSSLLQGWIFQLSTSSSFSTITRTATTDSTGQASFNTSGLQVYERIKKTGTRYVTDENGDYVYEDDGVTIKTETYTYYVNGDPIKYYVREAPMSQQTNKSAVSGYWTVSSTSYTSVNLVYGGRITRNNTVTGDLRVKKSVISSSNSVSGWTMQISKSKSFSSILATATTGSDGYATFTGLTPGETYYIREAPGQKSGWQLSTDVISAVVAPQTVTTVGTLTNNHTEFVSLKKSSTTDCGVNSEIEGNNLYSLKGAVYDLYIGTYPNGTKKETLVTDENGEATSMYAYEVGSSGYLIETTAPAGYKLDTSPWEFTLTNANEVCVVEVTDEPIFDPEEIWLEKQSSKTEVAYGDTTLEGAIFKWEYFTNYSCNGTPERTWYFSTNEKGVHLYGRQYLVDTTEYNSDELYVDADGLYSLPLGSIRVTEVAAPLGYVIQPKVLEATIEQDGNDAVFSWTADTMNQFKMEADSIVVVEDHITPPGSLTITKQAANPSRVSHDSSYTFAGCQFTVYNASPSPIYIMGKVVQPGDACLTLTLNAAGTASTGTILPIGTYTVKETRGNDCYLINKDWSETFSVTTDNAANEKYSFICKDEEVTGDFTLYKVEKGTNTHSSDTEEPYTYSTFLYDAVYKVWYQDGTLVGTYITDSNGMIQIKNLPYGTYTYQEITAPDGFELDSTVYSFKIERASGGSWFNNNSGTGTEFVRVRENVATPGSIKIVKTSDDGTPLSGVTFRLEYSIDEGDTWEPVYYRSDDAEVFLTGGCSTWDLWADNITDGILTTDANGECTFSGLRVNSQVQNLMYRLTEMTTNDGYTLLTDHVLICELPYDANSTGDATVDVLVNVTNSEGFTFPATGENDLYMVTVGATIAVVAVVLAVMVIVPAVFTGAPAVNKKSIKRKDRKQ